MVYVQSKKNEKNDVDKLWQWFGHSNFHVMIYGYSWKSLRGFRSLD